MTPSINRRSFVAATAAAGLAVSMGRSAFAAVSTEKLAILGGRPVRSQSFPGWPVRDAREDKAVLDVVHSGAWCRTGAAKVAEFEAAYAKLTGVKRCLATNSGTSALFTSLSALEIGPGDEVIVPPYTFIATINVVLLNYALPIFVDSELETSLIDARKIEAAITDRTALLMPVHIGGSVADMDTIMAIAAKHKLPVVEDACQAHLAEWRGRKAGTLGATGCFSFQGSKNLNSGDGGAMITSDDALAEKCYAFHNNSRPTSNVPQLSSFIGIRGGNLRMTEFQGAILTAQMTRLEEQARTRDANAKYLSSLLREIPGIMPARMHDGCTRNAYHLYMLRYDPKAFADLSRDKFLAALAAEGIPNAGGYGMLNREPYIKATVQSRGYRKIYSQAEIDRWVERSQCPVNDRLCQEAVWFFQNMLLGTRRDMDQIAEAIRKIQANAGALAKG
jgi:perosamine synthetase